MSAKTTRKSRFGIGLLIYVLVFAVLGAAALGIFRQWLAAYERSRLSTAVNEYLTTCSNGTLTYQWGAELGRLDTDGTEGADIRKWAQELIGNATCREQIGSDSEEKTYGLYDENGVCFETVTLRQTGEADRWGFVGWEVVKENINLEPFSTTVSVVIPENYSVEIGGTKLDSSYIVEKGIPFETLEPFVDHIKNPPTKARYRYGPVLSTGDLTVLDSAGQPVPEEKQTEYCYLDTCTAADQARIKDFIERWLAVYLPYADDLNHAGMAYFGEIYQLIIHGGELEKRIWQAQDGFEYGNVQKLEILSTDVNCSTDLGGGRYFVDFSYHIRTYGLDDPTEEDYRMRLLLKEEEGVLYAEQMALS